MDGHDYQALSDEAMEQEIEAALGVDPSPEFLPRIRERIASERMYDGWLAPASWRWAGAVGVAIAAAVIGIWTMRDPSPPAYEARFARDPGLGTRDSRGGAEPAPTESAERVMRVPAERKMRTQTRPAVAAPAEVLISPDEAEALRQLVAAIAAGQVEAVDIPELGAESEPLPPIEAIVLEPIELSPIEGLKSE